MKTASVQLIEFPTIWLVVALGGISLFWVVGFIIKKTRSKRFQDDNGKERDWSIPPVDGISDLDSPFHRWDARFKILSLIFFMFCVAALNKLTLAGISVIAAVMAVLVARVPVRSSLRRLAAMSLFLGFLLIVMPLTVPARDGDTIIVLRGFPFIEFNVRGFLKAALICIKASAIGILVEPLLATSPFSTTVQALRRLKVPDVACQMILLSHRYLFVFQDEAVRMNKGMRARGFRKRTDIPTLQTIGNFLGMLLVRSFERTQRIYDAMIARGYDGRLPHTVEFRSNASDWVKMAFWVVLGLVLLIADRLAPYSRFSLH